MSMLQCAERGDNIEDFYTDELKIYKGDDILVKEGIIIHQPTLEEICEYGEKEYFSMIHTLASVGADMKWQLEDLGIDYSKISDFQLFCSLLSKFYTQEQTKIILGDLNLNNFKICMDKNNSEIILYDVKNGVKIDEYTYLTMTDAIRKIHGLQRNNQLPGNETTRKILIEEDRENYELNKNKPYKSTLLNYISAMVNSEGFKHNINDVWGMKIYAFINSVQRISKIKHAGQLMQSGYSGFGINLNDISKKEIDWLGEL